MTSVEVVHLDGMRFVVRTRDVEVIVDRALGEGGSGPGFRSAELLLGALGTCTLGGMTVFARNTGIPFEGLRARVEAEQVEHPLRLGSIDLAVDVGGQLDDRARASLTRVGNRCKIKNTLLSTPEINLTL